MLCWTDKIETRCRYTLGGALFGALFPLSAWIFQTILAGRPLTFDKIVALHDAIPVNYIVDLAPLVLGGTGFVIGVKQAALERLAASLRDEVARQTKELRQMNEAKTRFLASMSHELRTPLNAIIGFSEIIKDQVYGRGSFKRYVDYAADIHDSGCHLLSLINDVLDLAKIEAGKIKLDPKFLDVDETLRQCVRLFAERADGQGIELVVTVAADMSPLHADNRALKQILFNLLSNALKFTPSGGTINISARPGADGWQDIAVRDTGAGIPADRVMTVLQPFEQVDNRYGWSRGGTGLGLSLVRELIELHGGQLRIHSVEAIGTTVVLSFPAQADLEVASKTMGSDDPAAAPGPLEAVGEPG